MDTPAPGAIAIHLAVLADTASCGTVRICGVLVYDGYGRRHLHELASCPPPAQLHEVLSPGGIRQLQLPLIADAPTPSSGGHTWRSWVLPTIPTTLRALPPELLAAAVADQLSGQLEGEAVS